MPQRSVVADWRLARSSRRSRSPAVARAATPAPTAAAAPAAPTRPPRSASSRPLSGDLSALGKGIQNSVDLAIKQANETNAIPGWTLEVAAEDDEAKPDVGKNAATKLAADEDVVGVVGTLNSSVAAERPAGPRGGQHHPGLAGQHQPDA